MSAQLHETDATATTNGGHGRFVGGLVLVGAGLVLLAGQLFTIGAWPLIMLALLFTGAGVATRTAGWFIPGGVLSGIGLGALLSERGLVAGDPAEGGLFLLAFAAGWLSITLLSSLFTEQPQRWALIPAGVMALIGTPLLLGAVGEAALAAVMGWLAFLWPLALIALGLVVLLRRRSA